MCPIGRVVPVAIGADLGGSKLAAGLVNAEGGILRRVSVPTNASRGGPVVLEQLVAIVRGLYLQAEEEGLQVRAVGVASAGLVDEQDGVVQAATDALPGFAGLSVRDALEQAFAADLQVPVAVMNDVHAMAIGEARFGAARGADETFYVSVGTGIGGALATSGSIYGGRHGFAGDVGHVVIDCSPNARRCPCGRLGHLEAYASGPAMVAAYEERASVQRLEGGLRAVAKCARLGDTLAIEVLQDGARLLGRVIGGLANLLDFELVVFGGGLINLNRDVFWNNVAQCLREEVRGPYAPRIALAELGVEAALVGAATSMFGAEGPFPLKA